MRGIGVPQITDEAIRLYRTAADHGDATACNRLGVCFALGRGVGKDFGRAVALFDRYFEIISTGFFAEDDEFVREFDRLVSQIPELEDLR